MRNQLPPTYFNPGQSVVIENKRGDISVKGMCKILGSREPCYLLVDMPLVKNQPILAPSDTWCVVRALSKGKAIGFRARIEKIYSDPFPIVVLSYPGGFQEVTVRKAERISCDIPALILARAPGGAKAASAEEEAADQEQKSGKEGESAWANEAADPESGAPRGVSKVTPAEQPAAADRARSVQADAKSVRRHSEEPFTSFIIDLSEGGCQVAVPSIHPDIPSELPSEILRQIRPERRLLHHPETLKEAFQQGDICTIQMELPLQERPHIHEAGGGIRWAKVFHHHHLLGLQFVQAPDPLTAQIRRLMEFQARFFTPPFEPL